MQHVSVEAMQYALKVIDIRNMRDVDRDMSSYLNKK